MGIKGGRDSDMYKPNGLDRKRLQTQLENCKLIAEVNQEMLDNCLFTKEELPEKLELAQSFLNGSRQWEELGDQTKSHDSLTTANIIIIEISAVIKHMLYHDTSSDDSSLRLDQSSARYSLPRKPNVEPGLL